MKIEIKKPRNIIIKNYTCPFHQKYPFANYEGCTCSRSYISSEKQDKLKLFKK